jgi:hypothetical protein
VNNPKEYSPPRGGSIALAMARCSICQAWWSTDGSRRACPCGGELEAIDMDEYLKTLPVAVPAADPTKK